jgi:lactate permease
MEILLAVLPILFMLAAITVLKLSTHRTALIAMILCAVIAVVFFHMPGVSILTATLEGAAVAVITIIFVIFSAVYLYNVSLASGAVMIMKGLLLSVSRDRRIAVLLIAFCFGGFLEGIAGFGTSVTIPVSMLILLGFDPLLTIIVCLIANTVPVAFGVLGVPVVTLAQVSGIELASLTKYAAFQLFPFAVLLPLLLVVISEKSVKALKGVWHICILTGLAFAVAQTVIALYAGPELAAVGGSVASLFVLIAISKLHKPGGKDSAYAVAEKSGGQTGAKIRTGEALLACSPYLITIILALLPHLLFSSDTLKKLPFAFSLNLYAGEGAKPTGFQFFLNSGFILFVGAVLGGVLQRLNIKKLMKTLLETLYQIRFSALAVLCLTIMSKYMSYSGMVQEVAYGLNALTGSFYPIVAPLVGALGTFLTGSDTSSNILFGQMQSQVATKLSVSGAWITSANAVGATAGKMISPQSIAIAVSSGQVNGLDGKILRKTAVYCIGFVLLMGLLVWLVPMVVTIT